MTATVNGAQIRTASSDSAERLGAANQARRDQRTEKLARDLVGRLADMPAPMLVALAGCVLAEVERRRGAR